MRIFNLFKGPQSSGSRIRQRDRINRSSRVSASYQNLEDRKMLAGDVSPDLLLVSPPVEQSIVAPSDSANSQVFQRIVDGTDVDLENDPYPSVGIVGDFSGGVCTGTLIAPTYVLTAAHCVSGGNIKLPDNQGTFEVGGQIYRTTRVEVHPLYDDFDFSAGYDIAIFELDRPVLGITPSPLYQNVPRVGQELTLVGFGGGGTGEDGFTPDFGTKRFGVTKIDEVTDQHIRWTFEDNQNPPESNTAPGDSGGPAFIDIDGVLHLAGVTSGGTLPNAGFGDNSFNARVDIFVDYIKDVMLGRDEHSDLTDTSATFIKHGTDGTLRANGRLQRAGDRDVFRMQFRRQSFVVFRVRGLEMDSFIRLYNQEGLQVAQNDDFDETNSRIAVAVRPGTYYLSVGSASDFEIGNFNLWSKQTVAGAIPEPDDHVDLPNANATIYELSAEGIGRQQGVIDGSQDRDVFQVATRRFGNAYVRVHGVDGFNPDVRIYDSLGQLVAENDDFAGTTNAGVNFQFLPGTYYVSVGTSRLQGKGSYRIWSNFKTPVPRDDHGNFINNSTGLSLNTRGTTYANGVISNHSDRDMFFFTANRFSKEHVIRVSGLTNNLDTIVSVYNSAGKRIATNDDTYGTNSRVIFAASAGESFYVAVDGKEETTGRFGVAIYTRK